MKRDGAIAPVIGVLLILTIIVSAIALLNATYIPNLKQQSEIEHLASVEKAFLDLSSDIDRMIAFGDGATIRRHIPLGGGEAPFSGLRSSGTLRVDCVPIVTWEINPGNVQRYASLTNISYLPIGNFWQNQGYVWDRGVVNITKGSRTTWLTDMYGTDAEQRKRDFIIGFLGRTEFIPVETGTILSDITISPIQSMNTGSDTFVSSNGVGTITLSMDPSPIENNYPNIDCINITIPSGSPVTIQDLRDMYESKLMLIDSSYDNCVYYSDDDGLYLECNPTIDVTITENPLTISVS
ncbi:MAG: hypothetical protein JXA44_08120 [Methanospirillaceae archaeon]|nr:hypothetical protein [Methanospirillaceae archaeon]